MGPVVKLKVKKEENVMDDSGSDSAERVVCDSERKSEAVVMSETNLYDIHRFSGQNYKLWKDQMEIYIRENKLRKYIDGTTPKPTVVADISRWKEKDAEAQAFLMRGLEHDHLRYLSECHTAAAMWAHLRTIPADVSC